MTEIKPQGALRDGWSAEMGDYAICCEWALDGDILLVADVLGAIKAFDSKSGRVLWQQHESHNGSLLTMRVHPDGKSLVTAGQDGRVLILDVGDGGRIGAIDLGQSWIEHTAWSPGGKWFAASCSRKVHVFDTDYREEWQSGAHPSTVSAIAWSDGQELATACFGRVTFYDMATKNVRQKLEWQGSLVSMVLSPDGDIVACGSQDNSVHFWRRSTGNDSQMSGYPWKPSNLAFDSTGTLLATGGGEIITALIAERDELKEKLKRLGGRSQSAQEEKADETGRQRRRRRRKTGQVGPSDEAEGVLEAAATLLIKQGGLTAHGATVRDRDTVTRKIRECTVGR